MTESGPVQKLPRLQTRMLVWILGALVVVWASFVFWAYLAGVEESDELTDGHLASVAAMVLNIPVADVEKDAELFRVGFNAERVFLQRRIIEVAPRVEVDHLAGRLVIILIRHCTRLQQRLAQAHMRHSKWSRSRARRGRSSPASVARSTRTARSLMRWASSALNGTNS